MHLILSRSFSIRNATARLLFRTLKPVYFIFRYQRISWQIDTSVLAAMPSHSLGHDIYQYLVKNDFSLIPKAESHDVYHVLLDFDSSMFGETCLQFALFGNGKRSLPVLATISIAVLMYPEYWQTYKRVFEYWRMQRKFYKIDFLPLLSQPTQKIRNCIFVPKAKGIKKS